jgi:hypothetical protein
MYHERTDDFKIFKFFEPCAKRIQKMKHWSLYKLILIFRKRKNINYSHKMIYKLYTEAYLNNSKNSHQFKNLFEAKKMK